MNEKAISRKDFDLNVQLPIADSWLCRIWPSGRIPNYCHKQKISLGA